MGKPSISNFARDAAILGLVATTAYCLYKTYAQSAFVPSWASAVTLAIPTLYFIFDEAFKGKENLTTNAKDMLFVIGSVSATNLTWWAAECLKNSGFVQSYLSTCGSWAPVVSTCINPATLAVAGLYCISSNLLDPLGSDLCYNMLKAPVFSTVCHASMVILAASCAPAWVTAYGLGHAAGFISALVLVSLFEDQLGIG